MTSNRNILLTVAVVASALLAACGGGGSASPGANDGNPAPIPPPVAESGVPVTYAPGSFEAAQLAFVNTELSRCGYGSYQAASDLTAAAVGHSNYMTINGGLITHQQAAGNPGFTGVTHRERLRAAGSSASRAAESSEGIDAVFVGIRQSYNALIAAPMHQADLLDGWSEIGVGIGPRSINSQTQELRLMTLAYGGTKRNSVALNGVRNFPCEGSVGIVGNGVETPNSLPELATYGPGLTFETNRGGSIEVEGITVVETASGSIRPTIRVIGPVGYTLSVSQAWRATHVTTEAMRNATAYRVEARGRTWATSNKTGPSIPWTRSYNFTTLGNPF